MDYREELTTMSLGVVDELILKYTPDDVIKKANELVHIAVDKDMTGSEKFEWVLGQVKPLLSWILKAFGSKLVQLLYNIMMEKKNG